MKVKDYYMNELPEYQPSTEADRKAHEQRWNAKRLSDYKDKKASQESLEPACDDYQGNLGMADSLNRNTFAETPEYIKWLERKSHE